MTRVGERARRAASSRLWGWVRLNAPALTFIAATLAITIYLIGSQTPRLGVPAGEAHMTAAFLGGLAAGVLLMIALFLSGAFAISAGADAEQSTAKEIRRFRSSGYEVINNVDFQGFDVDHVAIGPAGAIVIETKWTSIPWTIVDGRLEGPYRDPCASALAAARKINLFLNVSGGLSLPIIPAVAVWGPGRRTHLDGITTLSNGVRLIEGKDRESWSALLREGPVPPETITAARGVLEEFVAARSKFETKVPGPRFSHRTTVVLRFLGVFAVIDLLIVTIILLRAWP